MVCDDVGQRQAAAGPTGVFCAHSAKSGAASTTNGASCSEWKPSAAGRQTAWRKPPPDFDGLRRWKSSGVKCRRA